MNGSIKNKDAVVVNADENAVMKNESELGRFCWTKIYLYKI